MFSEEPDSQEVVDGMKDSMLARMTQRLDIYGHAAGGMPSSFLDYVALTSTQVFTVARTSGKLLSPETAREPMQRLLELQNLSQPGPAAPQASDLVEIYASKVKVTYDPVLISFLAAILAGEGIVFGWSHGDLALQMAENDIQVSPSEWAEIRHRGFKVLSESPPFSNLSEFVDAISAEVEHFRLLRSSDPTGRYWGGNARLYPGEYKAWTRRTLGAKIVMFYGVHTAKRWIEALKRQRDESAML